MTRVLVACLFLVLTTNSLAQTFACQFVASGGLRWEAGSWVTSKFRNEQPFFFTIKAGAGVVSFKGYELYEILHPTCHQKTGRHWCGDLTGQSFYFSEDTQKGAISSLFGAAQEKSDKDTLSISPFICQRM